ncbi:hypothetical protein T09_14726 [Trichinella sp. T9]|nr:hypothetical protein T09_14726 [Trichinella sp. T9]
MKVEKQEARVLLCTWTGKRTAGGRRRVELDRQPPLAGETAAHGCQRYQAMIIKVSRRVSVTSAFGQGTAGKGNRADMAAPLTPAYGHCIAARPDINRFSNGRTIKATLPTDYMLNHLRRNNDSHSTNRWPNYDNLDPGLVEVTRISNPLPAHVAIPAGHYFHARPETWRVPVGDPKRQLYDIETDRAPVGRQWAIKRARKMSPEN